MATTANERNNVYMVKSFGELALTRIQPCTSSGKYRQTYDNLRPTLVETLKVESHATCVHTHAYREGAPCRHFWFHWFTFRLFRCACRRNNSPHGFILLSFLSRPCPAVINEYLCVRTVESGQIDQSPHQLHGRIRRSSEESSSNKQPEYNFYPKNV